MTVTADSATRVIVGCIHQEDALEVVHKSTFVSDKEKELIDMAYCFDDCRELAGQRGGRLLMSRRSGVES